MPPTHIRWGKIGLLHNVVRTLNILHDDHGQPLPAVRYRAKVKLHGANAGVQVTPDGLLAQSRSRLLTPGDDRKGFARWVAEHAAKPTPLSGTLCTIVQRTHAVVARTYAYQSELCRSRALDSSGRDMRLWM